MRGGAGGGSLATEESSSIALASFCAEISGSDRDRWREERGDGRLANCARVECRIASSPPLSEVI